MKLMLHQPSLLDEDCLVATAVEQLADAKNVKERGAVFTRPEVVDFMLDLAGYVSDRPLHDMRLLEPSFGEGSFLLPVIGRLLAAWQASDDGRPAPEALSGCIRAVELHADTYRQTRAKVLALLDSAGLGVHAVHLADRWLVHGDFLLSQMDAFDVVVGNPPYVRQEMIPAALLAEYRRQFATIYDRADLYIPFIERSLSLLKPHGTLAFICADRWMKNRYGGPLRAMIAGEYRLKIHVDMTDTPAFQSDVIAYPAITVITREPSGVTRVASNPRIEPGALTALSMRLLADESPERNSSVRELAGVAMGNQPWLLETSHRIAVVRRLEETFPTLEEAGCKVGIGVATGADKAFIGLSGELDVEEDRKEPLVMTRDIVNGAIEWRGFSVVNPFADDGSLVDLGRYPRLKKYLEARKGEIANRHCARKIPANWYRTIDRITPALTRTPKLLVPDIKGEAHVVYDEGRLYPHHNLYFITAQEWDLHALQAVLLSEVARLFVATYSTRMRGGFLRFQAQYLRRIRLPYWNEVPDELRQRLTVAGLARDLTACNLAACTLYGLSARDRVLLKVDPTGHD